MTTIKVRLTLMEGMLGTTPNNEEIYTDFIGSKAPDASTLAEEVEAIGADGVVEKGMTVFPRTEDGQPFVYDYQIKGAFKDACSMLQRLTGKDPETGKKKKAVNDAKNEISSMALAIAEKVVGRELGSKDQKALVDQFIDELGDNT